MMALMSVVSIASGTVVACYSERIPSVTARMELFGGVLVVFGLALVGSGLPLFR